ncbi:MAG TPA: methyltransferase domain-containing protein [Phycisphaerae bacterium]|nr:methyltransferase domain-containing protein [Phycisphaerae bacterium]
MADTRKQSGSAGRRPVTAPRTFGPVSDLERHLPSDWWRTLFNAAYLKTDGDVVENSENTQREVDLVIKAAALDPNDRILDVCCGQGRHSLEFARRGFKEVTGIDRSRYLIRLARKRAAAENLSASFHEGDARKFRRRDKLFHCVMLMGNSFGYFEQKRDDESVLEAVASALMPGGVVFLDVVDGDWMRTGFEPRSWEWIDQNHFVCRERALAKDGERIISREVITHSERGIIADQFYAERLYSKEQLTSLLEKVGFESVRYHGTLEADSDRGQDLGMMAHRIILTARLSRRAKSVTPPSRSAPAFPKVTVLLGDPSLPDSVKVDGKFNPLDIDTVDRLKVALAELTDYEFSYIDDHQSLAGRLRAEPPSFVLNLCDEGYWNRATLELHIPALLDMHGIPYSGAGAACLGLCYNKNLVRGFAESLDIPTPMESYIGPDDSVATLPATFPALVKPNFGDSSIGITKDAVVRNSTELMAYIEWLRNSFGRCAILIQEFLEGTEYSVGVVGNPGLSYRTLPALQVDYSRLPKGLPKILCYESKWRPDSPYWDQVQYTEADITEEQRRTLYDHSNTLFERLECHDYARFDFRADANGVIKLMEVNPNPGWCWDGKFNMMAGYAGLRYSDLLRMIIEAAQERTHSESAKLKSAAE